MAEKICPQCNHPNRVTARFCAVCGAPLLDSVAELQAQPTAPYPGGEEPSAQPLDQQPPLNGRYRLEAELGRGGFGAVYRAWDAHLERWCAVKENHDPSADASRQFSREASILANLSHPNLPRVTDHFTIPGKGQYLVMDYIEGEDLETLLERIHTIPVDQALFWAFQVADALQYLHEQEPAVIHRDVKPANIRVTPNGRAILVDFGLVKIYDPLHFTTLGARAVTPGYAPPEQYGKGKTDARTDIYALAATLYAMLTGEEPLESVQRAMGEQFPTAHQLHVAVPVPVSAVIEKAMVLDPARRFQSISELKSALQAAAAGQADAAGLQPPPDGIAAPAFAPAGMEQPTRYAGQAAIRPSSTSRPASRSRPALAPILLPIAGLGALLIAFVLLGLALYLLSFRTRPAVARLTSTVAAQHTLAAQLAATTTAQVALLDPNNDNDSRPVPTIPAAALLPPIGDLPAWPVRFADDFTGDGTVFWIGEDFSNPHFSRVVTSQKPGAYLIQVDPLDASAYWFVHNPQLVTGESFVLTGAVRPDPAAPAALVGLVFRLMDEGQAFYWFGINSQAEISVRLYQNHAFSDLYPLTASGQSQAGAQQLTVYAQRDVFAFYVNQARVAEVRDATLSAGVGGIYIETYSPEAVTFSIENIQLQSP